MPTNKSKVIIYLYTNKKTIMVYGTIEARAEAAKQLRLIYRKLKMQGPNLADINYK